MANYGATKFRSGLMSTKDKIKLDELNLSLTSEASLAQIAGLEPTLDLQFNDSSIISQGITFARNSVGSYYGYDGIMRYAAANEARIDYDPVTEELKGLLIEESRQNLLTYTENFDNSFWTKTRSSIGVDSAVAPDGTMTADKLIEDATSSASHYIYANNVTISSSTTYTASIYAKAAERSYLRLDLSEGGGTVGYRAYFNLLNGTVTNTETTGSPTSKDYSITNVGNGWYRCSVTANLGAFTTADVEVYLSADGSSITISGDNKSGIYIWGAQLEAGSFPTSYIPSAQTFNGRSLFSNIAYASKSYEPNTPTTTVGTALGGITFKPDGTKMYLSTATGDAVYQYSLSTAWDVSTTTYDTKSFTESVTGVPYAIRFNNDGTKAFRVFDNGASSVVREYTLSVAYDISTMTYASVSYSLAATMTVPRGLEFSADGLFMYVSDATTDKIYRYTLGSAWSLSSVTASGELSVATQEATVNGIAFDSTGKNLILTGVTSDFIQIYTLGTAWDITTAKFTGQTFSATAGGLESQPSGLYLRPDNSNIYVAGITTDDVFQYTCTLASDVSSYYDSTGTLVKSTDIAFARNSYNPSPDKLHLAPKLLLEPAATNLLLQSENLAATWAISNVTLTNNNIAAPDGTTTADMITGNAGTAIKRVYQAYTTTSNAVHTFSVYLKAGTETNALLYVLDTTKAGEHGFKIRVNLLTGAITPQASLLDGVYVGSSSQLLPNGWIRVSISGYFTGTVGQIRPEIWLDGYSSSTTTGTIYLWGAQLEVGYAPTSYIPTTTAAVTRSADFYTSASVTRPRDDASMTGSNFTSWYRFDEGTFYCESESSGKVISGVQRVGVSVGIENLNDSAFRIYIGQIVGLPTRGAVELNGTAVAASTGTAYVANTFDKMSFAFATNNTAGSVSGNSPTTDTSCQIYLSANRMSIGNLYTAGRELNGHIKRLTFWPMRLSNDVLQKLTSKETSFEVPLASKYRAGLLNTRDKALLDSLSVGNISADIIAEKTTSAGVTADSVLLKDGTVTANGGQSVFQKISINGNDTGTFKIERSGLYLEQDISGTAFRIGRSMAGITDIIYYFNSSSSASFAIKIAGSGSALSKDSPARIIASSAPYQDTSTAVSGTVAHGVSSSFKGFAISALNTGVVYTNASTVYIDNAPTAGTNVTITNPFSLYVENGNTYLGGDATVVGKHITSKSQLTIATGIVTATKSYHTIAGEGGLADDLVTINGGVDGMRLLIRAVSDTVTITVKHNTGNIFLNGTDFVMDNQYDTLELVYDSSLTKWIEIARANNGA